MKDVGGHHLRAADDRAAARHAREHACVVGAVRLLVKSCAVYLESIASPRVHHTDPEPAPTASQDDERRGGVGGSDVLKDQVTVEDRYIRCALSKAPACARTCHRQRAERVSSLEIVTERKSLIRPGFASEERVYRDVAAPVPVELQRGVGVSKRAGH